MAAIVQSKLFYKEAMEQVHIYNSKLLLDRRMRMPYIDNQTGLAQQDCHLWVSRVQRSSPVREGQVYSYPSRRWRTRKRPDFLGRSKYADKQKAEEENQQGSSQDGESTVVTNEDSKSVFEVTAIPATNATIQPVAAAGYEDYYEEETFDSEFDSDEEFGSRKKKKKGKQPKSKKNVLAMKLATSIKVISKEDLQLLPSEDRKKPYDCQICGKRYKNSQGLRYHYEHYNHDLEETPAPVFVPPPLEVQSLPVAPLPTLTLVDGPPPNHVSGAKREKGSPPSKFCDVCLGSVEMNKRSGLPEKLICCGDCGRSAHPSCLQFNEKLTDQVQKYRWQCIECKCCCLCGTSDNDEQLLFCDDCDRGYHMYCLSPPIAEPPEGSWQCQLCNARIQQLDISKAAVLPEHMDTALKMAK